jgi:formate-dependent nitrite reductase membrane component NrfD
VSVSPPTTDDGRNIDLDVGALSGEGATIRVKSPEDAYAGPEQPLDRVPSDVEGEPSPTYYGQPVIKEPVWKWVIPVYFHIGGVSGATSVLVAAADLLAPKRMRRMRHYGSLIGLAGDSIGAALLIHDLGRPSRFLHMLRVFRPTSPMSVGSWVLAGSGGLNFLAVVFGGRAGALGKLGKIASVGAGVLGLPLSGYTAVLLANSAVPVWQATRRTLPVLFVASAMASAAAQLEALPLGRAERRAVHRFGQVGKTIEIAAALAVAREASAVPRVARPLRRGASGALLRASTALNVAALVTSTLAGDRGPRRMQWASAALGTLGGLAMRFAVVFAGKASARDPRATFEAQRAGLGAAEVTRRRGRVEAPPELVDYELPEEAVAARLA